MQQNHCCPLHLWQCQPSTGGNYFASSSSSFWALSPDSISRKPPTYTSEILALHCRCPRSQISPRGIQLPTHTLPIIATWPSSHSDIKPSSHLTIKLDIHTFSCMTIYCHSVMLLSNMQGSLFFSLKIGFFLKRNSWDLSFF